MQNCSSNELSFSCDKSNQPLYDETIENYIDNKKKLYNTILIYLEASDENQNQIYFEKLTDIVTNQQITEDQGEMQEFLQIIKNISDNHQRDHDFNSKIEKILLFYKTQINHTFTNIEIFSIFEDNKIILFFLFKNGIITVNDIIYKELINRIESNDIPFCYFFYPEIEKFIGTQKLKDLKNEIQLKYPNAFDNYENKRQEGENDSYICYLIRHDSVEEFISYINRMNYSISSQIQPSLFETNSFLIENQNTSLIEYSAFFGSIQIFQYLMMSGANLTPSLWLYSIHSKNGDLIHLLESNKANPPNNNYMICLIESIKCHHNDIAEYIKNNLLLIDNEKENEDIYSNCLQFHNYLYFQADFFYLNFYHYDKIVDLLLKKKKGEIDFKIII